MYYNITFLSDKDLSISRLEWKVIVMVSRARRRKKRQSWVDRMAREMGFVCAGEVKRESPEIVACKMSNGEVFAATSSDGVNILEVKKDDGSRARLETRGDDMTMTRSSSGSIEFLFKQTRSPEVIIRQEDKRLGPISIGGRVKDEFLEESVLIESSFK